MRRVRVIDIAAVAGVSPATVSRVQTNAPHVAEATRQRVLYAMQQLGSGVPARALVGLILPDVENPFFTRLAFLLQRHLRQSGLQLLIVASDGPQEDLTLMNQFVRLNVAAIAYIGRDHSRSAVSAIVANAQVPVIVIDREIPEAALDFICVDNRAAIFTAVAYLRTLGHQKITHLAGSLGTRSGKERHDAFQTALGGSAQVLQGDFQLEGGYRAAAAIAAMSFDERPTAVVTANDLMAIGLMHGLLAEGLRIPEDISVIGFDDIPLARWMSPALTTIEQPAALLAREASELLIRRIRDGQDASRRSVARLKKIEARLVVRASTGPAPGVSD